MVINRAFLLTSHLPLQFLGDFVVVEVRNKERKKEKKKCTVRTKERIKERKKETT